jgi:hypothetical protein
MQQLKYGPIGGRAEEDAVPALVTAGETFRTRSGRFVTLTTNSGQIEVADDGDTLLCGWVETGDGVTVTGEKVLLIPAAGCSKTFRIPIIAGTLTQAMIGATCDLVRATVGGVTLVQGAKLDASGEDNLIIVGGDIEGNVYVDVKFNPAKITGYPGVA